MNAFALALSPADLFRAWETATAVAPALRGAALVASVERIPVATAGDLPLGELSRRLLRIRGAIFGPAVTAVTECPQCQGRVELRFHVDEFERASPGDGPAPVVVPFGPRRLTLRHPNSVDLLAAGDAPDREAGQRRLFRRCLVSAHEADGTALSGDTLEALEEDEEAQGVAATAMTEADPHVDLELGLACPHCRHDWAAAFDPGAFLFREITAEARRLLRDVHELAMAYGWSEAEILALPAERRAAYRELIHG